MTHDEQRTAIKKLVSIGVLIVTEKRLEHKTYYRIDEEKLNEILDNFANSKKGFSRDGESGAPEVDIVEFGESTLSSSLDQEITTKITTIDPSIISLTKKSKVFDPNSLELPNWLSRSTWHSWLQYRKEINKPVKSKMTVNQTIKLLAKCRDRGYSPEDIINTSIANGWQGLFEPKETQTQKSRFGFKEIAKTDVFITDDFDWQKNIGIWILAEIENSISNYRSDPSKTLCNPF
ncbi:hypothetical protein [Arsenophonus nasoniae]|uniref:Uncharacterized protein n=1 Tax=Arsenophonus nasoniae TaxID=638 RepID=A0A4P7L4B3_9GAMM|nr:hypothetical protein [Arsenophonus nasoniae]QBY45920.1 hypothetical protein ArsFIN_45310 [Arsenophonus nasoniae]